MCTFTRLFKQGRKRFAVFDASGCLGARLPQVNIVPNRREGVLRKRRLAPRLIQQRHEGEQPAPQTHQKPQQLNPSRHDQLPRLKSTRYPIKDYYESTTAPADRLRTDPSAVPRWECV